MTIKLSIFLMKYTIGYHAHVFLRAIPELPTFLNKNSFFTPQHLRNPTGDLLLTSLKKDRGTNAPVFSLQNIHGPQT